MIIKNADDKSATIDMLEQYLADPRIPQEAKRKIEKQRNNVSAGAANERDSAYFIDFRFGASQNWMVLHDLRVEEAGRTTQIDHLLINRLLEFYVLESKSFSNGISINDLGEFNTWIGNRPAGIPSPIEQNRRHMDVLGDLLRALPMPTRLGIRIAPTMKSFVLVANKANIKRPAKSKFNSDEVIKVEMLAQLIDRNIDEMSGAAMLAGMAMMVGQETIVTIARLLESEHRPIAFDYASKFGLAALTSAKSSANFFGSMGPQDSPKCPKCGSELVMHKALKGTNAGNSFWGCSTYPKCRGTVAAE